MLILKTAIYEFVQVINFLIIVRVLMSWIVKMTDQKPGKTPDEIEFLEMFRQPQDFVSAENAKDLIAFAGKP